MKKINSIFKNVFYDGENKKTFKKGLLFLCVFLSLYIAVPETLFIFKSVSLEYIVLSLAVAVIIFMLLLILLKNEDKISFSRGAEKPFSIKIMVILALISLFFFFIWWYSYYPGGFEMDSSKHWDQIASGAFTDWHPGIYNIFLYILGKVIKTYTGFLFIQQVFISLALGYMGASLISKGINKKLITFFIIFVSLLPAGGTVTNYLGKDNAFAAVMILYVTQMINIFLSEGNWLKSKRNIFAFGIVLCFVTLFRHNGIFATLALILLMFSAYKKYKRQTLAAVLIMISMVSFIKGPVYYLCDVKHHDTQLYEESIGLPLTMMGYVIRERAYDLPETSFNYLTSILTLEGWENDFYYCWNDVKWIEARRATVYNMGMETFIKSFFECLKTDSDLAVYGALNLTRVVWQPFGELSWDYKPGVAYWTPIEWELDEPLPLQPFFQNITGAIYDFTTYPAISSLFWFVGFHLLLLLLCSLIAFKRYGAKALMFAMSIFAYDIGTSLMLCGYDLRFFYFNFLVILPVCFVLLSKHKA